MKFLRRFATLSLPVLLALAPNTAPGTQDAVEPELVHLDETFGFRIARPNTDWMFVPKAEKRSVDLSLVLTEPSPLARVSVRGNLEGAGYDPRGARARKLRAVGDAEGVSEAVEIEVEFSFSEETVPGISMIVESKGLSYRVRQFFLAAEGRRFELEDVVVESEVEALAGTIDEIWSGFQILEMPELPAGERRLSALAAKCGSEVKLARDWADAVARAREEGKLIAVAIHLLPGFDLENAWVAGSFMDPDLIDLLNERYVPVLFRWGWNAPFEDQSSYGMGPSSFGRTMLLITPDGEVVAEGWAPIDDLLLDALERMPGTELNWDAESPSDPLDRAELLLRRGEYQRARVLLEHAVLEGNESARGHLLQADLFRRQRNLAAWGDALAKARAARDSAEHVAELDRAVALHALRTGRTEEAREGYLAFLESHADSPLAPRAAYRLGAIELKIDGKEPARERWMKLIDDYPDSRWAWKAAHTLQSNAFELGAGELLAWPPQEVIDSLLHPASDPWGPENIDRAREQAIEFLLETQTADGSWICPADIGTLGRDKPRNLTEAVTSICVRSLLPFRDRESVKRAIDEALDHLTAELAKDLERDPEVEYMDYTIWNRASQVYVFSECLALEIGDRIRIEKALADALGDLRERQHERGGWSYFISGTFGGGENPITQSISFVTAYVALALAEARETDVAMPEGLVEDALDCLERMRNDNGTFTYMLHHQDESSGRISSLPGSAGRGPLCALALLRHDRGSMEELRLNLDRYAEHHLGLSKQLGRALMHAGPYAEGSHWILFDYATASEALTVLPKAERRKHRALILADVLEARRTDGSYLDNQLIGRALGTAMALLAFGTEPGTL